MTRKASKLSHAVRSALAFVLALTPLDAPFTGAQKPTSSNRTSGKTMPEARAKWHPSPRELLFSEDPNAEISLGERLRAMTKPPRETEWDIGLAKNVRVPSASNRQPSASAQNTSSNVRLTSRDIGPETGYSGSGTGFTFNRDTRQVILPSPQRVFRSVNGGSQWAPLDFAVKDLVGGGDNPRPRTEGSYFVRQDPRNPQILYAVGSHGGQLARSNDFGTTWTQLEDSHPGRIYNFADIAVHETSSNVLLALKKGTDFSFDGTQYPPLWRSEDGGSTFTPQLDAGLPVEAFDPETEEGCSPHYSNIATTAADPNTVYVVQLMGDINFCPPAVHKSVDGGRTFSRLEAATQRLDTVPPGHIRGAPLQVFPHPTRAGVLFVQTDFNWIYRSTDGGASFQLVRGGRIGTTADFFVSFDPHNPSSVYVAGSGGVFRSRDGGETFQPLGLTAEQIGRFATNVNVDPANANVIYVNTWNGNFKSANGGLSFHAINNGWRAAFIRTIAFDNGANPTLYVATDHGIVRTSTRGHQYERVPGPSVLNNTRLLAVAPSNPDMILAVTSLPLDGAPYESVALHRTLDGGQSWTESIVDTGPVLPFDIAIDPRNSNNVYLVGSEVGPDGEPSGDGFYRSVDAGATFERTVGVSAQALATDPQHTNVIFASTASWPLFKSVDGGLNFAPTGDITDGQFDTNVTNQVLIDPQNPNNLFIVGSFVDPGGTYNIVRSTNGGATFSVIDVGSSISAEVVMNPEDPARLYCWATSLGLSVTSDRGNTWSLVPADEIAKLGVPDLSNTMLINPKKPKLLYLLGGSLLEVEIHDS